MQNKERTWAQDADSLVTLGGEADFWTLKKYLTGYTLTFVYVCLKVVLAWRLWPFDHVQFGLPGQAAPCAALLGERLQAGESVPG